MFSWKLKKKFEDQVRALVTPSGPYSGANRRAINLIPLPVVTDGHEIAQTNTVKFHQLLISIEGNQRSCCLKIISPKKKSRAALLIFRGRVLGCLYGRKDLDYHVFAQDAKRHALADLATPGNILDAYQLPEDLVLAAASLFHGQVLQFNRGGSAEHVFEAALQQIMSFGLPGCIVINTAKNEMICQVYLSQGKIIGVYSSADGWVESSHQSALKYIHRTANAQIMGSVLALRSVDDVYGLGLSLTGLGDRRFELKRVDSQARPSGMELRPMDHYELHSLHRLSPLPHPAIHPAHYSGTHRLQQTRTVQHAHAIRP